MPPNEGLRDATEFVIDARDFNRRVDGGLVREIKWSLTRSAALRPGEFRRDDQGIGVKTRHGDHRPPGLTGPELDSLVRDSMTGRSAEDAALELFVAIAKAQPFEDGNKRTALFAANALLLTAGTETLLQVPVDDADPTVADTFNDLLARAYVFGEHEPVKTYMADQGIVPMLSNGRRGSSS